MNADRQGQGRPGLSTRVLPTTPGRAPVPIGEFRQAIRRVAPLVEWVTSGVLIGIFLLFILTVFQHRALEHTVDWIEELSRRTDHDPRSLGIPANRGFLCFSEISLWLPRMPGCQG